MDPTFTDSNTHPRKGKWSKPHKTSRHDKRGPRMDPVSDLSENAFFPEEISAPVAPACTNKHPSLSTLYQTHGYRAYLDYVNTEYCESCSACKKQKAANITWMTTHAAAIEEAEAVYVDAEEKAQDRRDHYDWSYRNRRH